VKRRKTYLKTFKDNKGQKTDIPGFYRISCHEERVAFWKEGC
jgi:hypothetical protein